MADLTSADPAYQWRTYAGGFNVHSCLRISLRKGIIWTFPYNSDQSRSPEREIDIDEDPHTGFLSIFGTSDAPGEFANNIHCDSYPKTARRQARPPEAASWEGEAPAELGTHPARAQCPAAVSRAVRLASRKVAEPRVRPARPPVGTADGVRRPAPNQPGPGTSVLRASAVGIGSERSYGLIWASK